MKYRIPGYYYSQKDSTIVSVWADQAIELNGEPSFIKWTKEKTGCTDISGNWEDGWTLTFSHKKMYDIFLIKWAD